MCITSYNIPLWCKTDLVKTTCSSVIYGSYRNCVFSVKMAYISDKYVTDDKLLIKLCLGLFICTFIYSTGFIFCLYDLSVCLSVTFTDEHSVGVFWEWDVKEGVGVLVGGVNRRLEETAWWEASWLHVMLVLSAVLLRHTNCGRSESLFIELL